LVAELWWYFTKRWLIGLAKRFKYF